MATTQQGIAALGARVHLFVRPECRGRFISLSGHILGCAVAERDFGLPYPILAVSFGA